MQSGTTAHQVAAGAELEQDAAEHAAVGEAFLEADDVPVLLRQAALQLVVDVHLRRQPHPLLLRHLGQPRPLEHVLVAARPLVLVLHDEDLAERPLRRYSPHNLVLLHRRSCCGHGSERRTLTSLSTSVLRVPSAAA